MNPFRFAPRNIIRNRSIMNNNNFKDEERILIKNKQASQKRIQILRDIMCAIKDPDFTKIFGKMLEKNLEKEQRLLFDCNKGLLGIERLRSSDPSSPSPMPSDS